MHLYGVHRDYYWSATSLFFLFLVILPLGFQARYLATKYRNMFLSIGLKNNMGETPKLLKKKKIDGFRTKYIFDNMGIGVSEFEDKRERLEVYLKDNMESIKIWQTQRTSRNYTQ